MNTSDLRSQNMPRHVAIILDGNGRYATLRNQPRTLGHVEGALRVKEIIELAIEYGIEILTLWAFSKENGLRAKEEVDFIFEVMLQKLQESLPQMHANQIRVKIIGDRSIFSPEFMHQIQDAEELTKNNTGLKLNLAINYSGRWEIIQATKAIAEDILRQDIRLEDITQQLFTSKTKFGVFSQPDLLIRPGGVSRISNFMLWDLAFTELYFTNTLWPDFSRVDFDLALEAYAKSSRRFGAESNKFKEACYVE